jgi:hypothetical protein
VPTNLAAAYANATASSGAERYPIVPLLPALFSRRRTNRGFEALAASPSGRSAIALLQAPPTALGDAAVNASLLVPAVKIDLPAGGGEPTVRACKRNNWCRRRRRM